MTDQGVFLRCKNDIVGFARLVLDPDSGNPTTVIHGHRLETFASIGESLVAIYDIRIFLEFEKLPYPYTFKSVEGIPKLLGDMNAGRTMFKAVVAWDVKKTVDSSFVFPSLTEDLQTHSVSIISPIRHLLSRSESKVKFQELPAPRPRPADELKGRTDGTQDLELIDLTVSSDEEIKTHSVPEHIEESVDQFDLELREEQNEAESESDIEDIADITTGYDNEHIEESVDQFTEELREHAGQCESESDIEEMEKNSQENDVDFSAEVTKLDNSHDAASRLSDAPRSQRSMLGLSPAERIILRLNQSRSTNSQKHSRKRSKAKKRREVSSNSFAGSDRVSPAGSASDLFPVSRDSARTASNGGDLRNDCNDMRATVTVVSQEETDHFDICGSDEVNSPSEGNVQSLSLQRGLGVLPSLRKRSYRFINRTMGSPKPLGIRKKAVVDLVRRSMHINPFEKATFCCNNGCHSMVNSEFTAAQYRRFMKMDRTDRKRALHLMLNRETNSFWFDGNQVCSRFMVTLSFSNQLQSAVKATQKARATSSVTACPREVRELTKKDKIIMFLRNIAGCVGDAHSTKSQCNLPLLMKKQVYERFMNSGASLSEGNAVSFSYFCNVWKKHCFDFKTHRHHGFAVCTTCEQLRVNLARCESTSEQGIIRAQMDLHYSFIKEERRGYAERANLARDSPGTYVSLIVDGADQKGYGLPHFVFNTKDDRGHKLRVKCIGVLEHGQERKLSLFTMTEEFQTTFWKQSIEFCKRRRINKELYRKFCSFKRTTAQGKTKTSTLWVLLSC